MSMPRIPSHLQNVAQKKSHNNVVQKLKEMTDIHRNKIELEKNI